MGNAQDTLENYGYINPVQVAQGSFGATYKVVSKDEEKEYMMKEIKAKQLSRDCITKAKSEADVLCRLKHPYIVHYKESFEENGSLYIIMNYCEGGDLAKVMAVQKNIGVHLPEEKILDWFTQICLALKHIHDKGILHRDLKPQNIFLTEGRLILGDFGITKTLAQEVYVHKNVGTPLYIAPEVLIGTPYTAESDIWSLGWVLCELCMVQFDTENIEELSLAQRLTQIPRLSEHYTSDLQTLVDTLLEKDAWKRPSVNDILKKPFLSKRIPKLLTLKILYMEFNQDAEFMRILGLCDEKNQPKDLDMLTLQALHDVLKMSIEELNSEFEEKHQSLTGQIEELNKITDSLEYMHKATTVGSLTGAVMGAAGGITSIVGLILAPFTLGVSLAVTGVGVGIAVAGGATGAASNITNMVKQKNLRQSIQEIINDYQNTINPMVEHLNKICSSLEAIQQVQKVQQTMFESGRAMKTGVGAGKGTAAISEIFRVVQVAKIGNVAATAAKAVRVAGTITGVISGLFLILDAIFIAKESIEICEMNQLNADRSGEEDSQNISEDKVKKLKSDTLKFIQQMRKTSAQFQETLNEITRVRDVVNRAFQNKQNNNTTHRQ
ncbi:serine/threonine-protein kinase Nek3-like [Myxocyprinus asiaticus]|uniref:serine/threonine-protein kinase Nek3-like n=1 Tax=Myxocyprinus asiaticus TaxID=70543 RepID=UPI002222012A|nr:serine/threonine-protein kinase Nek3-like [Myxocyprinus asiaticus]